MPIPEHYLKKRDVLWNPRSTPAQLSALGQEALATEAYSDALDFFERAKDEKGVQEIKKLALKLGDTFLLSRLERFRPALVAKEDWEAAQKTAESTGRMSMAGYAQKKLTPAPVVKKEEDKAALGELPIEEA